MRNTQDKDFKKTYLRGVQFIFKTPEGVSWIMFASEPINLVYDAVHKNRISSSAPFTGIIRLAYVPARDAADKTVDSSTGLRRLIYHAGVYPVGGQVSWEFHYPSSATAKSTAEKMDSTGKYATVHLSYATHTMTDNNLRPNSPANALLMLSLPHHAQLLPKNALLNQKHFDLSYRCIKGPMTPVLGSTWSYDEPLPDLDFDGPLRDIDHHVAQSILDQVEKDITTVLPTVTEDIYGFGKQVARIAQLAHISSRLQRPKNGNETTPDRASELLAKSSELLSGFLERFLSDQVVDGLVFDSNLGGLVSKNGLSDKAADFGNGR
jgi:endo-1,3(4)-beta-glucanase